MNIIKASFEVTYDFPVYFLDDFFSEDEQLLKEILSITSEKKPIIFPIVENAIVEAFPTIVSDLEALFLRLDMPITPSFVIAGGESGKNDEALVPQIIDQCIEHNIDRHSYILAIGGGAFIDMVGYAAAITHRGIRLLRMPTTVLGQNDAGVGVKNAINYKERKNFLGTFSPPHAVINNYKFITKLSERDKRAGIAEAIKVALIKDSHFFEELVQQCTELKSFDRLAMKNMIHKCAKLHLTHICQNGDPFERGSARPLDFGHWSAHAIEELSGFELRHGEAVAIGILVDSRYAFYKNWLTQHEYQLIENLILTLGFSITKSVLSKLDIELSLDNFRTHLGGELCITMLQGIGRSCEVNDIDNKLMQKSVSYFINDTMEE